MAAHGELLSAYELERLENIRQNEAHLEALGLDAPSSSWTRRPPSSSAARKKRPAASTTVRPAPPLPLRRSTRQRVAVAPYTDETPLPEPRRATPSRASPYEAPDDDDNDDDDDGDAAEGAAAAAVKAAAAAAAAAERELTPAPGSTLGIRLDVDAIVERHLGLEIPGAPTKLSAISAMTDGRGARFSKYVGSLEWRNAVVLWVNVGGSDYKNVFFPDDGDAAGAAAAATTKQGGDGGRGLTMTWYASARQTEETPVIQRLLSSGAAKASKGAPEGVLLFCRLPGEPYVCCGRLGYVTHKPGRQPLKFVWRLLDVGALREREPFRRLMSEAGAGIK
jgi:hypothetical protein